jgi:hypothetical protein
MSVNINADTTNGLVLTSDTSGELKLQSAGADIATVDSSGITMAAGKTIPAASLTGTLPAIDGSSLTGIPTIGVGQTWQAPSRSAGVTYTNTTGRTIEVMVQCGNGGAGNSNTDFNLVINGSTVQCHGMYAATDVGLVVFLVPNGNTYRINIINAAGAVIGNWRELR